MKRYKLKDFLESKDKNALIDSITDPTEQIDLDRALEMMKKIRNFSNALVQMDQVAVLSATVKEYLSDIRVYVAKIATRAKVAADREKGIATTDRAPKKCEENGLKPTGANVDAFVSQDEAYQKALILRGDAETLLYYLNEKRGDMESRFYLAKQMLSDDKGDVSMGGSPRDVDGIDLED